MWIIDINIKEIRSEQICTGKICKTYVKSCPPPATEEEDLDAAAVARPEYIYVVTREAMKTLFPKRKT